MSLFSLRFPLFYRTQNTLELHQIHTKSKQKDIHFRVSGAAASAKTFCQASLTASRIILSTHNMTPQGASKLCHPPKSFAMITKFLILAGSVSLCMVNAFDGNNYSNEPRDVSLQVQQQPFSFENLQRLRTKFQEDAHYRNENMNNNGKNDENRNTFLAVADPMSKDQDKSGDQTSYQTNNQPKFNEMEFFDEFESNLPYGIQNVRRDLTSRSSRSQKRLHKPKTTFQSLCPSKRLVIPLETIAYEYRPDHYEEVTCYHSYAPARDYLSETNKVCSEAGFTCIQLNRTVYLTRRAKGSECWESETRIVPSGCECMWPKHTFGDIITYH